MANYKAFLLVFFFMVVSNKERVVRAEESKCECAVFKFPTAETTIEDPILSKSPNFQFVCDADGKESCSNMCKTLASSLKGEAPHRICEIIKDTDTPYSPMIFYKACNDEWWTYSGMTSKLEICCEGGNAVPCS